MKDSRKDIAVFVSKLILVFLVVAGFALHLMPQYLYGYNAAVLDKVERLKAIDEPKIVLLGNSNLAFGIDSELIEEAYGMPVVNMGLHGGLGNAFHEKMALYHITPGDVYVVCHNTYKDGDRVYDDPLTWVTIEDHFDLWRLLDRKDIIPMIKSYPIYFKKCTQLWRSRAGNIDEGEEEIYRRYVFNRYGDVEWPDSGLMYEFQPGDVVIPQISDNVTERLNRLNAYLQERGATLMVTAAPVADVEDRKSNEEYNAVGQELKEKLDAPFISQYTDYIYPTELFFDAVYHLNSEGRKIRTTQLIEDMRPYMN